MSWLSDYLSYTEHQEAPELFHLWTGLTVMASVLNRRIYIERHSHGATWWSVYPGQMQCVLVSPPGKGYKTTAIKFGRRLMKEAGVFVIKGKGSTEKLINMIANGNHVQGTIIKANPDAIATIVAPELSVLLSRATYAESLIDFLTEVYDAEDPFDYMTISAGIVRMRNPCVTVLAGTTPVSIGESIPEKAHGTGWISRVLHIYHDGDHHPGEKRKPKNAMVDLNDEDITSEDIARIKAIETKLVDGLESMKALNGGAKYTPDGKRWMELWLDAWSSSPEGQGEGYPIRRPDHMLRIALILSVSERLDRLPVLDPTVLTRADAILKQIEPYFHEAFAYIGQSQNAHNQERVLDVLRRVGGRASSELIASRLYRYMDVATMQVVFDTLKKARKIIYEGISNGSEVWRLG